MPSKQICISKPGAIIHLKGPDAHTYLQSQCSQDIRPLKKGQLTYSLFLTRKGKVHADAFILKRNEDEYTLYSYFSAEDALIEKLSENIIADEVQIEGQCAHYASISLLSYEVNFAPPSGFFHETPQGILLPGRRSLLDNIDILFPLEYENYWLTRFDEQGFKKAEKPEIQLENRRLRSSIPAIGKDIGPNELPQEGALQSQAVSFNKGCYLGQEVMARLQSMGQVQRHLQAIGLFKPLHQAITLPYPLYYEGKMIGEIRSLSEEGYGLALLKTRFSQDFSEDRLPFLEDNALKLFNLKT